MMSRVVLALPRWLNPNDLRRNLSVQFALALLGGGLIGRL